MRYSYPLSILDNGPGPRRAPGVEVPSSSNATHGAVPLAHLLFSSRFVGGVLWGWPDRVNPPPFLLKDSFKEVAVLIPGPMPPHSCPWAATVFWDWPSAILELDAFS